MCAVGSCLCQQAGELRNSQLATAEQGRVHAAARAPRESWHSPAELSTAVARVQTVPTVSFKEFKSERLDSGKRALRGHMKTTKIFVGLLHGEIDILHQKERETRRAKGWTLRETHLGSIQKNIQRAQKLIPEYLFVCPHSHLCG